MRRYAALFMTLLTLGSAASFATATEGYSYIGDLESTNTWLSQQNEALKKQKASLLRQRAALLKQVKKLKDKQGELQGTITGYEEVLQSASGLRTENQNLTSRLTLAETNLAAAQSALTNGIVAQMQASGNWVTLASSLCQAFPSRCSFYSASGYVSYTFSSY